MASSSSGGGVPPGFRFHPTEEELLHYYLKKKVSFQKFDMEVIREVDLNKIEPWELQERCKIGSTPQNEWYFFSHKDRKYPTGSRTNRATGAGFWKATGRDKCIRNNSKKIGMRKTLVFYRGRAPHGQKTDWIMHEYRLDYSSDYHHHNPQPTATAAEDGWVVCRVFKKKNLFKAGGGGGPHHGNSMMMMSNINDYEDHDAEITASNHSRSLFAHRNNNNIDNNSVVNHLLHSHDLNNYTPNSIIPLLPPHQYPLESQNFIIIPADDHLNKPLMLRSSIDYNYENHNHDFSILPIKTATTTSATPSPSNTNADYEIKQLMSTRKDCERAVEPGYQAPEPGLECNQSRSDDQNLNEWDRLIEINATTSQHHNQESNNTNSSSVNQINPSSLRNETDFWAYDK